MNKSQLLQVTCLFFIDNLGFLAAGNSVIELKKKLKKAGKIIFDWKKHNAVIYNINIINAMLFFKTRKYKLLEQLIVILLKFSGQTSKFNQKTTEQLRLQLNNYLNFGFHFKEKLNKAKIAKIKVKRPNKTYKLSLTLIQLI